MHVGELKGFVPQQFYIQLILEPAVYPAHPWVFDCNTNSNIERIWFRSMLVCNDHENQLEHLPSKPSHGRSTATPLVSLSGFPFR